MTPAFRRPWRAVLSALLGFILVSALLTIAPAASAQQVPRSTASLGAAKQLGQPLSAQALRQAARATATQPAATASGFLFYKLPQPQPVCTGLAFNVSTYPNYSRDDCGFVNFTLSESATAVNVDLFADGADTKFATVAATESDPATNEWQMDITPEATWPAGSIRMVVLADGAKAGEARFGHNLLTATLDTVAPADGSYAPGDDIRVTGTISEADAITNSPSNRDVPATFTLALVKPDGTRTTVKQVTAASDGSFTETIPGSKTSGISAGPATDYKVTLGVAAVDASYDDPSTGAWAAKEAGRGSVTLTTPPTQLLLENSFVSAVGWVKPGETYPSRILVHNRTTEAFNNVEVTVTAPAGTTFTNARAGSDPVARSAKTVTWTVGTVAAAPANGETLRTLILESRASTVKQDPRIVWKNLSSTARLSISGTQSGAAASSHGPKVIPQATTYDTARYGDRPFPVVPVDYRDRKHQANHSGEQLADKINSKQVPGSTFNLYQEMSLGQLFPDGTVPSAGIASANFGDKEYGFTVAQPQGTCHGATLPEAAGTPVYPERITDGFYQLPGDTDYYGDDKTGSALVGAETGVGPLFDIDSACGPTGKLVYDSAAIADPEIDYSDYDTDKDGVVDFFMVVFAGCGGNGASQLSSLGCPYDTVPYDNVWPHSSSLEFYYTDPDTGLAGYTTDDQLKDLEGRKLYYTDSSRSQKSTGVTDFPVFVRVGPYNVNPETAIDNASVISHEYGHSLGLPDFYSLGGRETYGDWNLMATDKSQNMDVFSRQEMGWIVPEVLKPNSTRAVDDWTDSKEDTHTVKWQQRDGTPYTLTGSGVHNAQAYVAKLPGRQLIDPAKFETGDQASKTHAWWSGSGNDFGCAPEGGHNLDLVVPGAADLPAGSTLQLEFKSLWDIEWDYDYGFVLTSTNGGEEYLSHASDNGYTTPASQNPNGNACQLKYGNGLTGSSGSYPDGTQGVDRLTGTYPPSVFLADSYEINDLVGVENGVVRFSYATDPGLARPGWFIDDLLVTATLPDGSTRELFATDLEDDSQGGPDSPYFFSGGCKDDTATAGQCTSGWNYIASDAEAPADHAYYMELRDRSGFDKEGMGENDRDAIAFAPGLSMVYTDEAHGYGNVGTDNPPAQSPLDSQPQPGEDVPVLADAAWTATAGDNTFTDSGTGHTDNYTDPSETEVDKRYPDVDNPWRFTDNCLSFTVNDMAGEDIGPEQSNGNLKADVDFTTHAGCGTFDYGYVDEDGGQDPGNTAPRAVATAKPKEVLLGQTITFGGGGSTDAETPDDLQYTWDFGNGGLTKDAVGEQVRHEYADQGVYYATLTVTDPRGETDKDRVRVVVTKRIACIHKAVTRTGGWRLVDGNRSGAHRGHYCVNNKPGPTKGDSMRLRFRGPLVDIAYGRAQRGGTALVYIDGNRVGRLDFGGRSETPRFGFVRKFRGMKENTFHVVRVVMETPVGKQRYGYLDDFNIAGNTG